MDNILSVLPSIHSTLIGFVGAFVCAFGVYVLQKMHDIADAKASLVRECEELRCSSHFGAHQKFVTEDGGLDWSAARRCVKRCVYYSDQVPDEEVVQCYDDLLALMGCMFMVYPFLSGQQVQHFDEVIQRKRMAPLDAPRLKELTEHFGEIYGRFTHGDFTGNLRNLAFRYDQIKYQAVIARRAAYIERQPFNPINDPDDNARKRKDREQNAPQMHPFYPMAGVLDEALELLEKYRGEIIPQCHVLIGEGEKWGGRFASKQMIMFMLGSVFFLLLFGVFIPPVLVWVRESWDVCNDLSLCWSPWYSLILLVVTAVPYFVVGIWCWRKVFSRE
ncbi:hypothetical protein [Pseudomonas sp. 2835]|uniref:hypothetical protein n=1 Tax=Pseudomonas sp. 2835 TaxID=3156451 RepID=UPI003D1F808F